MSDHAPAFTVAIPCYNEENAIAETLIELSQTLESQLESGQAEIIVVDDGSSDGSSDIVRGLIDKIPQLRLLVHPRNRGYGAALKHAFGAAKGELIVITDADGTYPNHRVMDLVAAMEDADMAVGSRTGENVEYSRIRAIPKIFLRRYAQWLTRQNIPDLNSGFRAFRRAVIMQYIHILPDGFSLTTTSTLALMMDFHRVIYLPIDYKRRVGASKIKPIRDTIRFFALIARCGMYFAPWRVLSPFIALFSALLFASIGYDIFVLDNLTDKTVTLLVLTSNTLMFALFADMIDKRTKK